MRIDEYFGIKYPVIQGGMANIATGEFAAAVSRAGALGVIGAGGMNAETLRGHIRRCKELTDRPFGVNIMFRTTSFGRADFPVIFNCLGRPAAEGEETAELLVRQVSNSVLFEDTIRYMEALAQTGAVAILSEPENRGKLAVFGGIRDCRFRRQVVPGDTLKLTCEITGKRGNIGFGRAEATVDGELAARGELSFVIL